MQVNFVESNPDPGQVRDGDDGPARRGLSPADGAAAAGVARRRSRPSLTARLGTAGGRADRRRIDDDLRRRRRSASRPHGADAPTRRGPRRRSRDLRAALSDGERPRRRARSDGAHAAGASTPGSSRASCSASASATLVDVSTDHGRWPFFDKDTLPLKTLGRRSRRAHRARRIERSATAPIVGRGVICMPPMYVNIGAYVGEAR